MVQYTQTNERSKGREPWSSGFGKRLTFQRLWVRIPAPYTGWTFFTYICCKICIVCLKKTENDKTKKRPGLAHFFKKSEAKHNCWAKSGFEPGATDTGV